MAKERTTPPIDDFDFDQFDDDYNLDGDIDSPTNDRKSSLKSKTTNLARESAKNKFEDGRFRREVAKAALPKDFSYAIDDFDTISKEVGSLWREQEKAWEKERSNIRRALKPFSDVASKLGLKKIAAWAEEEERSRTSGPSDEELDELKIQSILSETFGAYQERQTADNVRLETVRQEKEDLRDTEAKLARDTDTKRGIETNSLLSGLNRQQTIMADYNRNIDFPYKKRSLELQARLLVNSQRMLSTMTSFRDGSLKELQEIHKNTGLPDFVKITPTEITKKAIGERIAGNLTKPFENVGTKALNRVSGQMKNKMAEWWQLIGEGASSINMFNQDSSEEDMNGNRGTPVQALMSLLTGAGMDKIVGGAANKANNYLSPKIRNYLEKHHNITLAGSTLRSMGNQFGGLFNEALKSGETGNAALDAFIRVFELGQTAETGNRLATDSTQLDLEKAAFMDQRFKLSVIDVIPGWLKKIYGETYAFNNKGKRPENLVWDFKTSRFQTMEELKDDLFDKVVKKENIEAEQEAVNAWINTLDKERVWSFKTRSFVEKWVLKEKRSSNALNPLKLIANNLVADKDVKAELLMSIPRMLNLSEKQVEMVADGTMVSILAASKSGGDNYRNITNQLADQEHRVRTTSSVDYDELNRLLTDSTAVQALIEMGILSESGAKGQTFLNSRMEDKIYGSRRKDDKYRRKNAHFHMDDGVWEQRVIREDLQNEEAYDAKYKQRLRFKNGTLGQTDSQKAYARFKQIQKQYGDDPLYHEDGFKKDRHGNIYTNSFILTKEGRVIYSDNEEEFSKTKKRLKFASGGKIPLNAPYVNKQGVTKGQPSREIQAILHGGEQIVNADATKTNAQLLAAINKYGARLINPDGSINSVYHKLFGFKSAKDFDAKKMARNVGGEIKSDVDEQSSLLISNIVKGLNPAIHSVDDLAFVVDKKKPLASRLTKAMNLFRKDQSQRAKADPKGYGKNLAKSGVGYVSDKFNDWIDTDGTGTNNQIKDALLDMAMRMGGNVKRKAADNASKTRYMAKHNLLDRGATLNSVRSAIDGNSTNKLYDKARDIYMEGTKAPIFTAFKFGQRLYVDQATGSVIKKPSEITGTVVDTRGEVVLSTWDLISNKFYIRERGQTFPFKFMGLDDKVRQFKTSKEYVSNKLDIMKSSETYKDLMNKANAAKLKYLLDKPIDIYTRTSAQPILFASKFKEGLYTDVNSGNRLWSHHDITGPVKDEFGAIVLSEEQLSDGLFDKDRKHVKISKIKQVRNNVFRRSNELYQQYASKHVNKAKDATLGWMSKVGERQVGMNYDANPIDIYVKGEEKPRITAVQFKKAIVMDKASGKIIKSHSGISGDVSIFENGTSNIAISKEELSSLVDGNGEKVYLPLTKSANERFMNYLKEAALPTAHFKKIRDFIGLSKDERIKRYKDGLKKANVAQDVYIVGSPDKPVLYKSGFEKGEYTSKKTGEVLITAEFIDGEVLDASGNVILNEEQLKKGLETIDGKKINTGMNLSTGGLIANLLGGRGIASRIAAEKLKRLRSGNNPPETPEEQNKRRVYTIKFKNKKGTPLAPSIARINNRTFSDDDIATGLLLRTAENGGSPTVVKKVEDIDASTWLLYPNRPKLSDGINFISVFENGGYIQDQDGKNIICKYFKDKFGSNYGLSMKARIKGAFSNLFSGSDSEEGGLFGKLFNRFRKGSYQEQDEQRKKDKEKNKDGKPAEPKEKKDSWIGKLVKRFTIPLTLLMGGLASGLSGLQAALIGGVGWLAQSLIAGKVMGGLGSLLGGLAGGRGGLMGKVFKGAAIGTATYAVLDTLGKWDGKTTDTASAFSDTNSKYAGMDTTSKVFNMAAEPVAGAKEEASSAGSMLQTAINNPLLMAALLGVGPLRTLKGLGKGAGWLGRKGMGLWGRGVDATARGVGRAGLGAAGAGGRGLLSRLPGVGRLAGGALNIASKMRLPSIGGMLIGGAKLARLLTPWGIGLTVAYYGGKWIYNRWKDNKNPWNRFRLAQYGFDHNNTEVLDKIAKIEAASVDLVTITKDGKAKLKTNDAAINEVMRICGLMDDKGQIIPDQEPRFQNFTIWYRERFVKVFASYLAAIQKIKGKAEFIEFEKMNKNEQLELMKQVHFTNLNNSPYVITQSPFETPAETEKDAAAVDEISRKVTWKIKQLPDAPPVKLHTGASDGIDEVKPPMLPKNASQEQKVQHAIDTKNAELLKSNPKTMVEEANKAVKLQTDAANVRTELTKKQMEIATTKANEETVKLFDESNKTLGQKFGEYISSLATRYSDAWSKFSSGDIMGGANDFMGAATFGVTDKISQGLSQVGNKVAGWLSDGKGLGGTAKWHGNKSDGLFTEISAAAKKYGLDERAMLTMAYIESKGDPNASNASGAKGIYQFMPGTAQQYKLHNPFNQAANIDAGMRLTRDSINYFKKKVGREPQPFEMYLMHQQGQGGAAAIAAAAAKGGAVPSNIQRNMNSNPPRKGAVNLSAAQFLQMWKQRYDESDMAVHGAGGGNAVASTTGSTLTQAAASSKGLAPVGVLKKELVPQTGSGAIANNAMAQLDAKYGGGAAAVNAGAPATAKQTKSQPAVAKEKFFVGDSIADGFKRYHGNKGYTKVGADPKTVLFYLKNSVLKSPSTYRTKDVYVSTGLSNNVSDLETIANQLRELKLVGVKVFVFGISTTFPHDNPIKLNALLQNLCKTYGHTFLGGFKAGKDNIHPASWSNLRGSAGVASPTAPAAKKTSTAPAAKAIAQTTVAGTQSNQPQAQIYKDPAQTTKAAPVGDGSSSWDIDSIISTVLKRAHKESTGKCALYIRVALQAGDTGKKIKGGLGDAWEYGNNLLKLGWTPIGNIMTCRPQKGDVCVFPKYNHLVTKGGIHGHVCIYTGTQWVSDFVQPTMYPSSRNNTLPHTIYRASGAVDNGGRFGTQMPGAPSAKEEPVTATIYGGNTSAKQYSSYNNGGTSVSPVDQAISNINDGTIGVTPQVAANPSQQQRQQADEQVMNAPEVISVLKDQLTVQRETLSVMKGIATALGVGGSSNSTQPAASTIKPDLNAAMNPNARSPFEGVTNPVSVAKPR